MRKLDQHLDLVKNYDNFFEYEWKNPLENIENRENPENPENIDSVKCHYEAIMALKFGFSEDFMRRIKFFSVLLKFGFAVFGTIRWPVCVTGGHRIALIPYTLTKFTKFYIFHKT